MKHQATYKSMRSDARYLNVTVSGNKKLVNNDKARFIIWNLPAKTTCPYKTAECEGSCYAKKAEIAYPRCLPSRQRNFEASRQSSFVKNMIYTIETELEVNRRKGVKKTVFRIHESGDFYNEEYLDKWIKIAEHFVGKNIVFMAYTKSVKYLVGKAIPKNMIIRYSVWKDTPKNDLALAESMKLPIYTAANHEDIETMKKSIPINVCRCSDCATCGMCWNRKEKTIVCEIH